MQVMESVSACSSVGKSQNCHWEKYPGKEKTICRKRHMIMITCLRQ
jgi:hypothetical protein